MQGFEKWKGRNYKGPCATLGPKHFVDSKCFSTENNQFSFASFAPFVPCPPNTDSCHVQLQKMSEIESELFNINWATVNIKQRYSAKAVGHVRGFFRQSEDSLNKLMKNTENMLDPSIWCALCSCHVSSTLGRQSSEVGSRGPTWCRGNFNCCRNASCFALPFLPACHDVASVDPSHPIPSMSHAPGQANRLHVQRTLFAPGKYSLARHLSSAHI